MRDRRGHEQDAYGGAGTVAAVTRSPGPVHPVLSNRTIGRLLGGHAALQRSAASSGGGPLDTDVAAAIDAERGGGAELSGPVREGLTTDGVSVLAGALWRSIMGA